MKAIYEIDVPKSCTRCSVSFTKNRRFGDGEELIVRECGISHIECSDRWNGIKEYENERAPFCPLKIVEE